MAILWYIMAMVYYGYGILWVYVWVYYGIEKKYPIFVQIFFGNISILGTKFFFQK